MQLPTSSLLHTAHAECGVGLAGAASKHSWSHEERTLREPRMPIPPSLFHSSSHARLRHIAGATLLTLSPQSLVSCAQFISSECHGRYIVWYRVSPWKSSFPLTVNKPHGMIKSPILCGGVQDSANLICNSSCFTVGLARRRCITFCRSGLSHVASLGVGEFRVCCRARDRRSAK